MIRVSVNISDDTAAALREVASDKGVSITESLHRLIGYGIIAYRADKDSAEVVLNSNRQVEQVVVL